ncbi:type II toxin-antitoxin system PemK/MazF family toxin [Mariniphaga sp.]|uniref:type II toxin-antitoxin system PemK/MazF family toxin n=1 Tax=Mariniphaga sp. TaxID=1954475 RepID=UPI0035632044
MTIGDIILIPFPFAEFNQKKVRPAAVITETADRYKDVLVSAISSVVSAKKSPREFVVFPGGSNQLRVKSVVKADRIVTVKREDIIAELGRLTESELKTLGAVLILRS